MDRISSEHSPQEHAIRGQPPMGMINRGQEGGKVQSDPFMSTQQLDSMIRKPGVVEPSRGDDFGMGVDAKKGSIGNGPEKMQKLSFNPNVQSLGMGSGGPMKRMVGGNDDKQNMDSDNLKDLEFVNPLLYKPASKPPVIKEGDWLCPDPTV